MPGIYPIGPARGGSESELERLDSGAGELTIGERQAGSGPVYTVRFAGEPVRQSGGRVAAVGNTGTSIGC